MSTETQIELENVDKHYGSFHALKDINLTIDKGSFVALVGPSGCGKSTLLRSLAGLETISGGTMRIGGAVMNDVPPRKRDVAMVFQTYALYPHMKVAENLTYSLKLKGAKKDAAGKAADDVAQTTGLKGLLGRFPRELSGGQRQRVAMGRAIIRNPKAFLFDEPLSNLDASLRVQMRKEIRALHDRLGATSVYVTHDQIEAMTMADHVVVMRGGVIEQQGAPLELYDHPTSRFVAGFIGSPAMNFIPGTVNADCKSVALDLPGDPNIQILRDVEAGQKIYAGLRPEHLELVDGTEAQIQLPVAVVEATGPTTYITTATDPEMMIVVSGRSPAKVGDTIGVNIRPELVHVFDVDTEQAV